MGLVLSSHNHKLIKQSIWKGGSEKQTTGAIPTTSQRISLTAQKMMVLFCLNVTM